MFTVLSYRPEDIRRKKTETNTKIGYLSGIE